MIYETSLQNPEDIACCNELVGNEYGLFDRMRLGGIGSTRLLIVQYSTVFGSYFPNVEMNKFANIELRPKGIIIHFQKQTSHFSWVIPYYKLSIYQSEYLSLHSDGHFLKFKKQFLKNDALPFFKRLYQFKSDAIQGDYYDYS